MSLGYTRPFRQAIGQTTFIAASTVNAQGTIAGGMGRIRVVHDGTGLVFLRTGTTAQVAVACTSGVKGDMPVIGGSAAAENFDIPPDHTHIAVITASGTANVYITPGEGI